MLLGHISSKDLLTYRKIHWLMMSSGKIWALVILNYFNFRPVNKCDFIYDNFKVIIELKNKSTTLNSAAYVGILLTIIYLHAKVYELHFYFKVC